MCATFIDCSHLVRDWQHGTAVFGVSETRIDRFDGTAERQEVRPMTWIRLESERYPPPAPTTDDQPLIDAEYRAIHEPQERARWRWRSRHAEPRLASRADLMPALKATFGAALRTPSMLVPF